MHYYFNNGFGGFGLFSSLFIIIFLMAFGIFAVVLIKGISQWNRNNHSPKLTVPATLVARRTNVSSSRHGGPHHHHHTSTTYYVTFQVESGDRIEFRISGQEYGLLLEGDRGNLHFQGTRYLGFDRA